MDKAEVIQKIAREVIKNHYYPERGVREDEINENSNFTTDLGLDSLDFVELACYVQAEYSVVITDEKLARVNTVGELADLVIELA